MTLRIIKALVILAAAAAVWFCLFTGTPAVGPHYVLKNAPLASMELSWLGTNRIISNSERCNQVIETIRTSRQSPVATSIGFGYLSLRYADGTTNLIYIQESSRVGGVQLVDHSGGYTISMGKLLNVFKDTGLLPQ